MFPTPIIPFPVVGTLTGRITVAAAGTPVTGPNVGNPGGFVLKALPTNTKTVWVFTAGATKAVGYPLDSGQAIGLSITNLQQIGVDAEVNGEGLAWLRY